MLLEYGENVNQKIAACLLTFSHAKYKNNGYFRMSQNEEILLIISLTRKSSCLSKDREEIICGRRWLDLEKVEQKHVIEMNNVIVTR